MSVFTKSLKVVLGLTVFGVSSYILYLLYVKDEDDDYTNTLTRALKFNSYEIRIPKDMMHSFIGRNGKNIKQIQEQSNTKITFKILDDSDDQICQIKGSREACLIAEHLVQEFLMTQPLLESEDIWVPSIFVGKIIGKNGDNISEISGISGAKVTINSDDNNALNTKRITIKGKKEQIYVAKSLIEDILEKAMEKQKLLEASLAKREPRLPSKFPDASTKTVSPKVERISPVPGQPEAPFEIYVSAMVDPSRFWVQIVGPKASELDCLVEEMTEYYMKPENRFMHILNTVKNGDLVAATFLHDNKWYRAEVLNVVKTSSSEQAELYYVDYGDTDTVACEDLYELRTDFLRLHFQAIECFLARVQPKGESWSEEAVDRFEEWTHVAQWKKLSAKLNGYSIRDKTRAKREGSPVPGVDLYDIEEHDVDIAEELVKSGLAVFKKETDLFANSRTTSNSNVSVASSS